MDEKEFRIMKKRMAHELGADDEEMRQYWIDRMLKIATFQKILAVFTMLLGVPLLLIFFGIFLIMAGGALWWSASHMRRKALEFREMLAQEAATPAVL